MSLGEAKERLFEAEAALAQIDDGMVRSSMEAVIASVRAIGAEVERAQYPLLSESQSIGDYGRPPCRCLVRSVWDASKEGEREYIVTPSAHCPVEDHHQSNQSFILDSLEPVNS